MTIKREDPRGWSPYAAGFLVGLLMIASIWFTGKYFGASTTFVRAAGYVERTVDPGRVAAMEYFKKELPKIDWQFLFVVGIFIGSLIAASMSGSFKLQGVPSRWEQRFGPSKAKRGIVAFVGGIIAMFGARLADG